MGGVVVCGVVSGAVCVGFWCVGLWCVETYRRRHDHDGTDVYPLVQANGRAVCQSARCVLVCCCTVRTTATLHSAGATLLTPLHGQTASFALIALCVLCGATLCALYHANQQPIALVLGGCEQWNSGNAPPDCPCPWYTLEAPISF